MVKSRPRNQESFAAAESVGRDLAKFLIIGKLLLAFGNFLTVYLVFGKIVNLLYQILYGIGQMFIALYSQILNK